MGNSYLYKFSNVLAAIREATYAVCIPICGLLERLWIIADAATLCCTDLVLRG